MRTTVALAAAVLAATGLWLWHASADPGGDGPALGPPEALLPSWRFERPLVAFPPPWRTEGQDDEDRERVPLGPAEPPEAEPSGYELPMDPPDPDEAFVRSWPAEHMRQRGV